MDFFRTLYLEGGAFSCCGAGSLTHDQSRVRHVATRLRAVDTVVRITTATIAACCFRLKPSLPHG
jgi:hypothetical protein